MNLETIKQAFLDNSTDTQNNNSRQSFAFFFINSKSGSSIGRQWLTRFQSHISIDHAYGTTHFIFYDFYCMSQRESSFCEIKRLCDDEENVKVIICGGDGTVQWVLSEAIIHKVDFQRVVFSVLPFGTGNDFASSIGWGKIKFTPSLNSLKMLATRLEQSQICDYDIWQCNIQCYKDGRITQIKSGVQKILKNNSLTRNFTNYFGIGTDAQITYIAQLINAKTIFFKKVAYTLAWIVSSLFPSKKISSKCHSFQRLIQKNDDLGRIKQYELSESIQQYNQEKNKSKEITIGHDSCVTFLNSTYSMQLQNIWGTPHQVENIKTQFSKQRSDDGLIEVVSYRNSLSLCLQRLFHMAKKVDQGKGPFTMVFRQPRGGKDEETYIHINGEAYKVEKLLKVEICKSTKIKGSRIKVLKNKN